MKSLHAANALLRSGPSTCNAISRSAPILSSRIASTTSRPQGQFALAYSHSLPLPSTSTGTRSFSQTTIQYRKRNKNKDEEEEEPAVEEQGRGRKGSKKDKQQQQAAQQQQQQQQQQQHTATTTNPSSQSTPSTPSPPGPPQPDPENPYDLSDLTHALDKTETHHTEELKKLRSGGRFNADVLGAIPVHPDKKKNPSQSYPLRELATVAPLGGRKWSILAFEESSVKPIMSAILGSAEYNQQPQRSEENPLELTISVEPERGDALAKRVKEVCLAWRGKIRDVSRKREAVHKRWRGEGTIVADDLHRLKERVAKAQEERMKVVGVREKEALAAVAKR